jgi:hypothetical protein
VGTRQQRSLSDEFFFLAKLLNALHCTQEEDLSALARSSNVTVHVCAQYILSKIIMVKYTHGCLWLSLEQRDLTATAQPSIIGRQSIMPPWAFCAQQALTTDGLRQTGFFFFHFYIFLKNVFCINISQKNQLENYTTITAAELYESYEKPPFLSHLK